MPPCPEQPVVGTLLVVIKPSLQSAVGVDVILVGEGDGLTVGGAETMMTTGNEGAGEAVGITGGGV